MQNTPTHTESEILQRLRHNCIDFEEPGLCKDTATENRAIIDDVSLWLFKRKS